MTDKLFFQLDDVRAIRKISRHMDNFEVIAREVQMSYVEKILGPRLYAALQDDIVGGFAQQDRFVELVEGVRYDDNGDLFIYRGLKDYACYIFLYLQMLEGGLQVTPIGAQLFKDEEAEHSNQKQEGRQLRDHSIRMADAMEEGIIRFLEKDNRFPEYDTSDKEEPARDSNNSFEPFVTTFYTPFNRYHR